MNKQKDPFITAVGVSKLFKTEAGELTVLKKISLMISEGEMVGIIGASGAGKSTLLHILGALDKPTEGKVLFQGTDIATLNDDAMACFRNERIGFVFQFHHLLPEFNAVENVMLPCLVRGEAFKEAEKKARGLLDELGLSGRMTHRPGELSGGEQQRVAVARALVRAPRIVLADEPTGNLDTSTGNDLFELFLRMNREKGITFAIVTHNEVLSNRCHRIIEMADGMIR